MNLCVLVRLMTSMQDRDLSELSPMLYSCGFPCKPCPVSVKKSSKFFQHVPLTSSLLFSVNSLRYSRLRRNSKLMREAEAQPFWDSLEAMVRRSWSLSVILPSIMLSYKSTMQSLVIYR